jgi:hypothetical protein
MSTLLVPDARGDGGSVARPDSTPEALGAAVERLAARAEAWFALPAREKLRYVRAAAAGTRRVAADQVRAACAAKGHPFDGPLAAEDWFGGPVAQLRGLRLLARTLERVAAGGPAAAMPREVRTLPDGRLAVDVFPADWRDRVLFAGVRGEVWLAPGVTRGALAAQVAALYGPTRAPTGSRRAWPRCSGRGTSPRSARSTWCTSCSPRGRWPCSSSTR